LLLALSRRTIGTSLSGVIWMSFSSTSRPSREILLLTGFLNIQRQLQHA